MNRQERIKAAVELINSKEYNDTISHGELLAAMHETGITTAYRDAVHAAMRKCMDCGKMIESIHGFGYRVVNPDEYTEQSVKCIVSGARRIDRGVRILQHAPVREMSAAGLENYNRVSDRVRILQASVSGAKVEIQMLTAERKHPFAAIAK